MSIMMESEWNEIIVGVISKFNDPQSSERGKPCCCTPEDSRSEVSNTVRVHAGPAYLQHQLYMGRSLVVFPWNIKDEVLYYRETLGVTS